MKAHIIILSSILLFAGFSSESKADPLRSVFQIFRVFFKSFDQDNKNADLAEKVNRNKKIFECSLQTGSALLGRGGNYYSPAIYSKPELIPYHPSRNNKLVSPRL